MHHKGSTPWQPPAMLAPGSCSQAVSPDDPIACRKAERHIVCMPRTEMRTLPVSVIGINHQKPGSAPHVLLRHAGEWVGCVQ